MSKIYAPFTPKQVELLNAWQKTQRFHPFTCTVHGDVSLVASTEGWSCPVEGCTYTQNWAHDFMADAESQ